MKRYGDIMVQRLVCLDIVFRLPLAEVQVFFRLKLSMEVVCALYIILEFEILLCYKYVFN